MGTIDFDVLDSAETPAGTIYLCRRDAPGQPGASVFELQINGNLLMSSLNPVSERQLSTSALALHQGAGDLRVLVGGLGLGFTAEAALASPRVKSVRVVDKTDFVIGWFRDGRLPLSELMNSSRVELVQGDVYADLLGPASETYDLILVDVDHSPDMLLEPGSAPFYTVEGQARVAEHLAPGGVLGVWSASDDDEFAECLSAAYPVASREYVAWVNEHEGESREPIRNVLFLCRKD